MAHYQQVAYAVPLRLCHQIFDVAPVMWYRTKRNPGNQVLQICMKEIAAVLVRHSYYKYEAQKINLNEII